MVGLASLWLPILLASVLVFVASSIIHMLLPYHKNDFAKLPDEDGVMDVLRGLSVPPGEYMFPSAGGDPDVLKSDAFREKARKGPVGILSVFPAGDPFAMGSQLTLWFLYCVLVSVFAGYLTSRAVGIGTEYLEVFRFAGTTAFAGYALALLQRSIWYKQPWSTTLKNVFDGLIYALLTAGTFGWLWPA
jgi:hypothetical protein